MSMLPRAHKRTAASRESRPNPRAERSAARRDAIIEAAFEEFSARGFAATRLDDVAQRAGVAKGTIYLHFQDKEELFQELVRSALGPIIAQVELAQFADAPLRVSINQLAGLFVREVLGTRRKDIIRLVISEGPRFPKVAEFYYSNIVGRALAAMRHILQRAVDRGEIKNRIIVRFPQLIVAPGILAVIWSGLFDRFEELDAEAMMQAHLSLLFDALELPAKKTKARA
jgi:AcrR family transcriptional regulator